MVLRPDGTMSTHLEGTLTLAGTAISVSLAEIFAVLDEESAFASAADATS